MENKYYIAIETKPKNYFPINLLDLKISNKFNTFSLEELDKFTLKFNKQEIIDSIKESNLLEITNDMPLVVIYYEKNMVRKINALTKDINFDMWKNINDNYKDKNYLNKIYNFLNNKISSEELSEIKECQDIKEFFNKLSYLPYLIQRKLYLYLYEQ